MIMQAHCVQAAQPLQWGQQLCTALQVPHHQALQAGAAADKAAAISGSCISNSRHSCWLLD